MVAGFRSLFLMRRLTFILITLASTASAMNGIQQIGYGAKARGLGGASIAYPQDAFAIANNPACLVCIGSRIDGGLNWLRLTGNLSGSFPPISVADPVEELEVPQHPIHSSRRNLIWPELAGTWNCNRRSLGLAIYSYGGFDTLYPAPIDQLSPTPSGMELKVFFISPCWSQQVSKSMTVGIAVNVAFAWLKVRGLETLLGGLGRPQISLESTPASLRLIDGELMFTGADRDRSLNHVTYTHSQAPSYATNRRPDHEEGLSLRLGWLWSHRNKFAVGLTYQTPTWINRFKHFEGLLADHGNLQLPGQLGIGLCLRPHTRVVLAADFVWIGWVHSAQFRNPFPTNDQGSSSTFGGSQGPGFGWHDRLVVKCGAAYSLNPKLMLRAGWNWSQIPFNRSQILLNFLNLGLVENHITLGGTYLFCCHELTVAYTHGIHNHIQSHSNATAFAQSLNGHQNCLSLSYGRRF